MVATVALPHSAEKSDCAVLKPSYTVVKPPRTPPVTKLPFDVWECVVDHLRDDEQLGYKTLVAVMSTCSHLFQLFEIFLYRRLELQGPHIHIRIDQEMMWDKQLTITRAAKLLHNVHLRRAVSELSLTEWACPAHDPYGHHTYHHFLIDEVMRMLPDMTRLHSLRIHEARLDNFAYYMIRSLDNLDILHLHNCSINVDYVDVDAVPLLSPSKLSIRDLNWESTLRCFPLVDVRRVRTFNTNSTELMQHIVEYAERHGVMLPFVDLCLTNDTRSFSIYETCNSGNYTREEMLNWMNRLMRLCPRALRLRVSPWVKVLDSLDECCPLLHSFYCATGCARSVLRNKLLTTLEVYPYDQRSPARAKREMGSLVNWMEKRQLALPPIFTYMASYEDMEPLELLDLISPVIGNVEILEIKIPDMHCTCPWQFNSLYRRHGTAMPKLQTFVLGSFTQHEVPAADSLRQYECWVHESLAEWSLFCPEFVRFRLGEFAIWENYDDGVWRARFVEDHDLY